MCGVNIFLTFTSPDDQTTVELIPTSNSVLTDGITETTNGVLTDGITGIPNGVECDR
jgi:hypothetical protein